MNNKRLYLSVLLMALLLAAAVTAAAAASEQPSMVAFGPGSYSGDDAYDPAAGGRPQGSILGAQAQDAASSASGAKYALSKGIEPSTMRRIYSVPAASDISSGVEPPIMRRLYTVPAAADSSNGVESSTMRRIYTAPAAALASGLDGEGDPGSGIASLPGRYSGDDAYDPAAGGRPQGSILGAQVQDAASSASGAKYALSTGIESSTMRRIYTVLTAPDSSTLAALDSPSFWVPKPSWSVEAQLERTAEAGYVLPDSADASSLGGISSLSGAADSPSYWVPEPAWTVEGQLEGMTQAGYALSNGIDPLTLVRIYTARYHRLEAAKEDGFEQLLDCIEDPTEGAMGVHYIKADRFDGELDVAQPEALVYQPQENGQPKLLAAEFIIPAAAWSGSEPPTFLGQTLQYKTSVGSQPFDPYYELHVWVWSPNPSGVFADWNPNVMCSL